MNTTTPSPSKSSARSRPLGLTLAATAGGYALAWIAAAELCARIAPVAPRARDFLEGGAAPVFWMGAVVIVAAAAAWHLSRAARRSPAPMRGVAGLTALPSGEAVLVVDEAGLVAALNESAERMFGCAGEAGVGRRLTSFLDGSLEQPGGGLVRADGFRDDGAVFPAEVSVSQLGGGLRMVVVRDIARRIAHEVEIERLRRLYAALSQINQAIVMTHDRDELFSRVCQVLSEYGGFRMAWIGWHDPDSHALCPVASWGDREGYLKQVTIYVDERPEGQGPTGIAFREDRPYVCNDLLEDPATLPFRVHSLRQGFRSSAAFPIRIQGVPVATLTVYADEAGCFQDREVAILTEAAFDISFALDAIKVEGERRTAEAAARSEKLFSDSIIESMPGILYFYDEQGRFLRWNRNFEEVSGYTASEIGRMHPLDFFAEADRGALVERISQVFDRGESSVEAPFLSKDGRRTPYYFTGRRLDYQGRRCLVGVGIDISERKRAEAALRELASTLEHRVAERTAELEAALVRAEAADRLKSSFLATMSHELRTPLNSIIGFTGIVLRGMAGPLNPEQAKQLSMVRASARHLLELINDVLDLSKIEAGQLTVHSEPFDLPASIDRSTALVKPLAEKKGLGLSVAVHPGVGEIVSDRRRVEQILLNLLNNAVKFTQAGEVSLSAELVPGARNGAGGPAHDAVRLRVADTGIGIKPEDLEALFKPFRQIDTGLSREHEGTGLGLAICRRLAGLLGGEISVESQWSRGSVFTVDLPLKHRIDP